MRFITNGELTLDRDNYVRAYEMALGGQLDYDNSLLIKQVAPNFEFDYPHNHPQDATIVRSLLYNASEEIKARLGRLWLLNWVQTKQYTGRFHLVDEDNRLWLTCAIEPIEPEFSCNFLFYLRGKKLRKALSCMRLLRFCKDNYFQELQALGYCYLYAATTIPETQNFITHANGKLPVKFKPVGQGEAMRYNGIHHHCNKFRLNLQRWENFSNLKAPLSKAQPMTASDKLTAESTFLKPISPTEPEALTHSEAPEAFTDKIAPEHPEPWSMSLT